MFSLKVIKQPDFKKKHLGFLKNNHELMSQLGEELLRNMKEEVPVASGRLRASHRARVRAERDGDSLIEIEADTDYMFAVLARNDWPNRATTKFVPTLRKRIREARMVR